MIIKLPEGIDKVSSDVDKLVKSYKNLSIIQTVVQMRTDGIADAEIKATLAKQGYAQADIEQAIVAEATNTAKTKNIALTKLQTIWQGVLTVSTIALNAALTAGAGILISMAASGIVKFFDNLINREENLAEAAKEAKERIDELNDAFVNQKKTVKSYSEEYAELAQGVNLLTNENLSLSTEDYERFLELTNILADTFPTLKTRIDDNGNAILGLNGNVDSIVESLNELIEAQQRLNNQEIAKDLPKVYEDYYENLEKTDKKITELSQKQRELYEAREYLLSHSADQINGDEENLKYQSALNTLGIDYTSKENIDENGRIGYIYSVDGYKIDEKIVDQYNLLFTKSQQDIQTYNDQLSIKLSQLNQRISAFISSDIDFNKLDQNLQAGITQLFHNFDIDNLPEYIDKTDYNEIYNYLKNIYLDPVIDLNDEMKTKLSQIFNRPNNISDQDYIKMVEEIQTYFDKNDIAINLSFMVEDEKDLQNRINKTIKNLTNGDKDQSNLLNDFVSSKNTSQLEMFIQISKEAENATDAIYLYNKAVAKSNKQTFDSETILDELSNIRSAYTTVSDAVKEYRDSKHLTLETIESLLSLDDKYLKYLYDENGQLTLNKEAYNQLTQAKLNEMYVSIVSDAMKTVESLEDEADAAHYLKLMNLELAESNWDLMASELGEAQAYLDAEKAKGNKVSARQQVLDEAIAEAQRKVNLLQEATKGMAFDNFYESNSSSSDKKEFSKEFDWIANSVENVSNAVDNLNDKLNNTKSFKDRISIYDDLIQKDQELIDATKDAASAYEKEWNKASNKIGKEYKNKILSGETFNIETITDETLANNIEDAQDVYNNWQSMIKKYNEAVNQKKEDKRGKIQVKLELEEAKLDIHSIDDQEDMSSIEKNKYIKEEEAIKKKILDYNLQLAETEEEKILLQKEYNEYLKDNQDLIYENNKQQRANKNNYYDSRIQDIQNAIDLSESQNSQAKEKQYKQINDYIQKQIGLEQQNYEAALEKRNEFDYGTEKWDKYNQEIQEAQNNINQLTIDQIENNRAILKLPIKAIEDQNKVLEDRLEILEKTKQNIETSISAASDIVQNQIDVLEKEKEVTTEFWDSQIDAINEQKDALTKANDEIKNQIALEKAQYELEKAKNSKTTKIYREGQGFVYEVDQDALRDAQEELDNQNYNSTLSKLENEIEALEKSKEEALTSIDIQINSLDLYKERIDSITESYQKMLDLQQLISMFGQDSVDKIMNGDLSIIDEIQSNYNDIASQTTSLQLQIEANEKAIEQIETYAEKWNGSSQTIQLAKLAIEQVVSDNSKEIKSIQQRIDTVKTVGDAWEETRSKLEEELGFIQNNQIIAKDDESVVLEERLNNIKSFAEKAAEYLKQVTTALSKAEIKQEELNKITNNKNSNDNKNLNSIIDTMGEKHTGLETGYVGESNNNKDKFKYIALSKLKPEEVPTVLLKGESVLNKLQQNQILDNMKTSFISGINEGAKLIPLQSKSNNINRNIEFNGDIILQNVSNPDQLATKIKNEFLIRLDQEFYK